MYTSHGHHIPGTDKDDNPPVADPCGGVENCSQCINETVIFSPTTRVVVRDASPTRSL